MALYEVKVSGLVMRELQVEAESGSQAQEIAKTMFCEMLLAYPENVEELWNADDDELAELLEEYEDEDVEVCPYCGHERGNKFQCCGEVHWTKRSEMEDA